MLNKIRRNDLNREGGVEAIEQVAEELGYGLLGEVVSCLDKVDSHFGCLFHYVVANAAGDVGICAKSDGILNVGLAVSTFHNAVSHRRYVSL